MSSDSYLWLRPALEIFREGPTLALVSDEGEVLQFDGPTDEILTFLLALDGRTREADLAASLLGKGLLHLLRSRSWLVTLSRPLEALLATYTDLSREISAFAQLFPEKLDEHFAAIAGKKVLLVGCGGIGTHVAYALNAAGVGHLAIVDPDMVEATNINRQFLFNREHVGQPKVEALASELKSRFPGIGIDTYVHDFDNEPFARELVESADLVVVCGETTVLLDVPDIVVDTPIITCGYRGATGTVGPLVSPKDGSACWECLMSSHMRQHRRNVSYFSVPRQQAWAPSGFAINSMTGSICARICIEYLSDQPTFRRWLGLQVHAQFRDLTTKHVPIEPRQCSHTRAPR